MAAASSSSETDSGDDADPVARTPRSTALEPADTTASPTRVASCSTLAALTTDSTARSSIRHPRRRGRRASRGDQLVTERRLMSSSTSSSTPMTRSGTTRASNATTASAIAATAVNEGP